MSIQRLWNEATFSFSAFELSILAGLSIKKVSTALCIEFLFSCCLSIVVPFLLDECALQEVRSRLQVDESTLRTVYSRLQTCERQLRESKSALREIKISMQECESAIPACFEDHRSRAVFPDNTGPRNEQLRFMSHPVQLENEPNRIGSIPRNGP